MKITKNKIFSKVIISFLIIAITLGGISYPKRAYALLGIGDIVTDVGAIGAVILDTAKSAVYYAKQSAEKIWEAAKNKFNSEMYHQVLSTALRKIAFDTATWLGKGAKGQKPQFMTEDRGKYLANLADNAAGQFIESVSKEAFGSKFNLCEPDINIKVLIGLGLTQPVLTPSNCSFTKMKTNWTKEVLQNKKFLSNFQDYFSSGGDIGMAVALNDQMLEEKKAAKEKATLNLIVGQGYNDITDPISGKIKAPPGTAKAETESIRRSNETNLTVTTGDIFVDAAKVFANQYFITLFNETMRNIGSGAPDTSSPYLKDTRAMFTNLINPQAQGDTNSSDIITEKLTELIQPNFNTDKNFEVVSALATCANINDAGPDDCVIDTNFSSAINDNLTVGQAITKGYLREGSVFGFNIGSNDAGFYCDGTEPAYNQGYPYRSMLILRKYRILPVGWELAAQYIHDHPKTTGTCTLGDLVACYDDTDSYTYKSTNCNQNDWCRGLVDPNWVLTSPQQTCKRQGPGPIISSYDVTKGATDFDSSLVIKRTNYCADEQSCIYKDKNGKCIQFGYCMNEKRKWNFGGDSCDSNYNTCETFTDSDGKTKSLMENTVDNSTCTADNVGCLDYCTDYKIDKTPVPMVSIEQDGVVHTLPSIFVTDVDAATFYGYSNLKANQPKFNTILTGNNSILFVQYDKTQNIYSLGFIHGWLGTHATFTFTNISTGNKVVVDDDTFETGGIPSGNSIASGASWNWNWVGNVTLETDGGMIQMPADDWSVTIQASSMTGLSSWLMVYDSGGPTPLTIPLDFSKPLTISKTSLVGNFTCLGGGGNKLYLDNNAVACDKTNEGCHEFIRSKNNLGTNLIKNSSFEDNTIGDTAVIPTGPNFDKTIGDWHFFGNNLEATVIGSSAGQVHSGQNSLKFKTDKETSDLVTRIDTGSTNSILPVGYKVEIGKTYSFSAWIYAESGSAELGFWKNGTSNYATSTSVLKGTWERVSVNLVNDASFNADTIFITGYEPGSVFYIDDIQFEESQNSTNYNDYRKVNVVYEKLLPSYLGETCYQSPGIDYSYKNNYPKICDNYARLCNKKEVGCEMYTSANTGINVPAIVDALDYCTAECVGYDEYMQMETIFSSLQPKYLIPQTATACDAGSVGCEEFTNLDKTASGGEQKEYYSYLKQCVKPSDVGSNCGEFYTWEGSSETGFQLKVHSLQVDNDIDDVAPANYIGDPAITSADYDVCNELIYKLNLNPECREFYNTAGQISYHVNSKVITCSEDCHPFRMTKNNVAKDAVTGADISWPSCQALSIYPDKHDVITNADYTARGNECVFCKNGGTWDSASASCLYKAIPTEGTVCSATVNGCKQYSGNNGNSIYNVFISNFEGDTQGWSGFGGTTVITDSDSLRVNEQALRVQNAPFTIVKEVGTAVRQGSSYYLEFLAKSISGTMTATGFSSIYLINDVGDVEKFATDPSLVMTMTGDYALYKLNISSLNHAISDKENIVFVADGDFMIDDIKLVEITDRYYLNEDSWVTPTSCVNDIYGNPKGQIYNLGCDEYTDRAGNIHYLHNFPNLCQESAVGCEEMIDTHNSTDYNAKPFHAGDKSEQNVVADSMIYAVYDQKKECDQSEKGCQILGKPYNYGNNSIYREVYFLNNPDTYGNILCYDSDKNCKAWTSREGTSYFKDPGDQTCEYRQENTFTDPNNKVKYWGWFKTAVKRCDTNTDGKVSAINNVCLANTDCGATSIACKKDADCTNSTCISGFCNYSCITDSNDYPCSVTQNITYGTGGEGSRVDVPTVDINSNNWVGICPSAQGSCTEYLDPVSNFSVNLLANGGFTGLTSVTYQPDWHCSIGGAVCTSACAPTNGRCVNSVWKKPIVGDFYIQAVSLEKDYIYRLAGHNDTPNGSQLIITCPGSYLTVYNENTNNFGSTVSSITINLGVGTTTSKMFRFNAMTGTKCQVQMNKVQTGAGDYAEVKKIVVDYQLETGLDKTSCNGIVNRDEGCVLFNERKTTKKDFSSIYYSKLNYDADNTILTSPQSCNGLNCNGNQLIKVTPDRTCDQWLACTAIKQAGKNKDNVCMGIGTCDKLDSNGNCDRFVATSSDTYSYPDNISSSAIQNMSGYVKVGYSGTNVNLNTTGKPDDKIGFGSMSPYGGQAQVANNSFEFVRENVCTKDVLNAANCVNQDYPASTTAPIAASPDWGDPDYADNWSCAPQGSSKCETIDTPIENEGEKICYLPDRDKTCKLYAPDGAHFMKINADNDGTGTLTSAQFSVMPATTYVMSYYVNTLRLIRGKAKVTIREYSQAGGEIGSYSNETEYRKDWQKEERRFTTSLAAASISIELTTFSTELNPDNTIAPPIGNAYFDDFNLLQSIQVRTNGATDPTPTENFFETKDCRLYPKDDSLSCDYYKDGIRYKGWMGYCMEYDRYPGWSNACLQWWSIPNSVDGINAWCGDGKVGGDEDCECPPINGVEQYDCDSQLAIKGTSISNEYRCENCMWAKGWCGDNNIDISRGEQCDWNDKAVYLGNNPNLGYLTVLKNVAPNNFAVDTKIPLTCANLPAAYKLGGRTDLVGVAPDGEYDKKMFTGGRLGCYSHDGGYNSYGGLTANDHKCKFDVLPTPFGNFKTWNTSATVEDFSCNTDLSTGAHKVEDCIAAGGVVVSDAVSQHLPAPNDTVNGAKVIDSATKETIVTDQDFGETFCRFTNATGWTGSLGASAICGLITGGNGGWQAFTTGGAPWTKTISDNIHLSCSGSLYGCTGDHNGPTDYHNIFQNKNIDYTTITYGSCNAQGSWTSGWTCVDDSASNFAKVVEIGCY